MKKFFAILSVCVCAFACAGCENCLLIDLAINACVPTIAPPPWFYYEHPTFTTEYTVEEHVERIRKRTEERYAEEIESGELVHFEVEIVYAFYDDDPEYFLIEYEYAEETIPLVFDPTDRSETDRRVLQYTKYKHLIGFISDDEYYTGLYDYEEPMAGRSSFEIFGYSDTKKYYGAETHAVETESGELLWVYRQMGGTDSIECDFIENPSYDSFTQAIVPQENLKKLMENNYKPNPQKY